MINFNKLIKFRLGTIPLIISVPHGGTIEYKEIPTRSEGVLGIDKGTIELTHDFISYIRKTLGHTTTYIISKIRRSKIDLNRKEEEAYFSDSLIAKEIYQFYHNKIKDFINFNLKSFNRSLLIDLHGFDKAKRPPGFRDVELVLGTKNLSSISRKPIPIRDRDKNVRGKIIKKFLELEIPIAPGHPKRKEYVLTGGYITQKYGASKIFGSKSLQIEFSDRIRLNDKELKYIVLKTLTEVILKHLFQDTNLSGTK